MLATILYNITVLVAISFILIIYIKEIWKYPKQQGEAYSYWVASWVLLAVMQVVLNLVELNILPRTPFAYIAQSLLLFILANFLIVAIIVKLERELASNNIKAWRQFRFSATGLEILAIWASGAGLSSLVNGVSYTTDAAYYGSTLIKSGDLHYIGVALLLAAAIPLVLWPWFEGGKMNRVRFFLAMGGLSQAIGKAIQFVRTLLESQCPITDRAIQVFFLLSVVLVYLGIRHKRSINMLEAFQANEFSREDIEKFCRDTED